MLFWSSNDFIGSDVGLVNFLPGLGIEWVENVDPVIGNSRCWKMISIQCSLDNNSIFFWKRFPGVLFFFAMFKLSFNPPSNFFKGVGYLRVSLFCFIPNEGFDVLVPEVSGVVSSFFSGEINDLFWPNILSLP